MNYYTIPNRPNIVDYLKYASLPKKENFLEIITI